MPIAYLDCFSGIAGDMVVGACLDLGLEISQLEVELAKLPLRGYEIQVEKATRGNLSGSNFTVKVTREGHVHRRFLDISKMIQDSFLSEGVKETALGIFSLLAQAEAKIHNLPVEEVTFHEVGATDSIVDVVGSAAALEKLGVKLVYASEIPLGQGEISCLHGRLPSPAPATLEILKGVPVYSTGRKVELVTPTGAAIVRHLARSFGPFPPMIIEGIGYGAGDNDFQEMPNMLRIILGQPLDHLEKDNILIMETNIDDMNPQLYEGLMERLLAQGALDVTLSPLQMKKNRPGVLLRVLCPEEARNRLAGVILSDSTALGVRFYRADRLKKKRKEVVLKTKFGNIKAKIALGPGEERQLAPEYDDCRRVALELALPVKDVYTEALKAALAWQESSS